MAILDSLSLLGFHQPEGGARGFVVERAHLEGAEYRRRFVGIIDRLTVMTL